jgi:hypothetical protein
MLKRLVGAAEVRHEWWRAAKGNHVTKGGVIETSPGRFFPAGDFILTGGNANVQLKAGSNLYEWGYLLWLNNGPVVFSQQLLF